MWQAARRTGKHTEFGVRWPEFWSRIPVYHLYNLKWRASLLCDPVPVSVQWRWWYTDWCVMLNAGCKRACFPTQHASLGSWHSSQGLGAYTPLPVLLNLGLLRFFVVDSKRGKKHFSHVQNHLQHWDSLAPSLQIILHTFLLMHDYLAISHVTWR